jgi:hypothetical protein
MWKIAKSATASEEAAALEGVSCHITVSESPHIPVTVDNTYP